jgi:hypothetical protein
VPAARGRRRAPGGAPKPPPLGDWFPLDREQISRYVADKAARLTLARDVTQWAHLSTATTRCARVTGDHGRYVVWFTPHSDPPMGACGRGGVHDLLPDGEPCSHPLAGAVDYELLQRAVARVRAEGGRAS